MKTLVGIVRSKISSKSYEVYLDENGNYSCSCIVCLSGKSRMPCKNVQAYLVAVKSFKKEETVSENPVVSTPIRKSIKKSSIEKITIFKQQLEELRQCL